MHNSLIRPARPRARDKASLTVFERALQLVELDIQLPHSTFITSILKCGYRVQVEALLLEEGGYLGHNDVVCVLKQPDDNIAAVATEAPLWFATSSSSCVAVVRTSS
jgi:hypothetical protein